EQLLGPGGAAIAELLRRLIDEAEQLGLVGRGDLGPAIVLAAVGQPPQAPRAGPAGDAGEPGLRAEAPPRQPCGAPSRPVGAEAPLDDPGGRLAAHEGEDHLAATPHAGILGTHREPPKLRPLAVRKPLPRMDDLRSDQGGAPSTGVFGDTT